MAALRDPGGRHFQPPRDLARIVAAARSTWAGSAYAHVPAEVPIDIAAIPDGSDAGDRWSAPGQVTAYLASDPGVAIAELGRHTGEERPPLGRRLLRLDLRPFDVLDLRDDDTRAAIGVGGALTALLDRALARSIGEALRATGCCAGLVVPSMALLDQPERHCVVVFADRLPGGFEPLVERWTEAGRLRLVGDQA